MFARKCRKAAGCADVRSADFRRYELMKWKKFRKIVSIALVAVMSLALLAGCGGKDKAKGDSKGKGQTTDKHSEEGWNSLESGEVVDITFTGRGLDTEKSNYQQFVDDFNQTHDNILANLEWYADDTSYEVALDGMGDDLPDVFMLQDDMFLRFVASGKLADITDHLDQEFLDDLYLKGYEIYYFDAEKMKAGKSDAARLYGLPKDMGPYAMAVNTGLLNDAVQKYNSANPGSRIDVNRVLSSTDAMNFNEFMDIGKKLKTVLGAEESVISGLDFQSTVFSNNAQYFTEDESGWHSQIDSDNFVEALTFAQNCYKEGLTPGSGTTANQETYFTSGRSIFYGTLGPWTVKDWWPTVGFDWDIIPVLQGTAKGAVSTAVVGSMCYAISSNCECKDAALELVKYLATDPSSQRTQYMRGQCIPNLKSLATEFSNDTEGFIAGHTGKDNPCPAHRSVWIDVVDGVGGTKTGADGKTYTDELNGSFQAVARTLDDLWYTEYSNWITGGTDGSPGSLFKAQSDGSWVDVRKSMEAFKPQMQALLDEGYAQLHE